MSAAVQMAEASRCAAVLLRAFGLDGAARASLAPYTVHADITVLLDGIDELVSTKASRLAPQNGIWGGQKACSGT
jgi:selenocysteine lyase/cysteine desulfurase